VVIQVTADGSYGEEASHISIPGRCGIEPSTGISLLRRYD